MAIKLEFCNVIVPVDTIRKKLGNGTFESRFAKITSVNWHDGHLFRDGCMNPWDLEEMLDEWESMGFELLTMIAGKKHWKDLCVVNSGQGPSYPCEWIEYDPIKNIVWMKGREPGVAVGPSDRKVAGEV
jgi:hypothetical protein